MDRDNRWDRTELALDALVARGGRGQAHRQRGGRGAGVVCPRPDRRVRAPDARGGGGPDPRRGRGAVLQLPPRPGAPADLQARRAGGRAPDHAHQLPRGVGPAGGLPARAPGHHPGAGAGGSRHRPAARRRDREVRARDLLPQRWRGGAPRRGGALPGRLAPRRAHLRPQARDERPGRRRRLRRALGRRRLRLRHHQLRQPGHGRPHRGDPRRGEGGGDGGRVPGPRGGGGARGGWRLRGHGRPRQRRPHAGARRQPQHRPLAQPGAARS